MKALPLIIWSHVLFLLSPQEGLALRPSDVVFEDRVEAHGQQLRFQNRGTLKYKRLINVYETAFYLQDGQPMQNAQSNVARRIEVVYLVASKAKRFCDAGARTLEKAWPEQDLLKIQERLDRLNSWYPDARKGDRCQLTYVPGKGTELTYNDRSLGVIEGEDFARIYFSIWLGEQPADRRLRDQLLADGNE